jgi:hypothetical protein
LNTQVTSEPTVMVDRDPGQHSMVGVTVCGLDPDVMVSLGRYTQAGGRLQCLLRVSVVQTGALNGDDLLPDIFGHYQVLEAGLRFVPHFPFERGLLYRASFDPRPLGRSKLSEVLTVEFSSPRTPRAFTPQVQHIFPSSDNLPENLLRFYVGFSNPMQRGRAEAEIAILGSNGEPVPDVLYRPPVELWDRSMRYLTILLDPGRLKRWVGPNRELGPPLKAGQAYTLAVGAGMLDCSGRRLTEPVYKHFQVTEAIRERIEIEHWKVFPPSRQSREALVILFPRPLDWALLAHTITIASTVGQSINGRSVIDEREKRWRFTPEVPWVAGSYYVSVPLSLEDVCGNNAVAPFDRPLRSGKELGIEVATRSIAFHPV